jgi:signal transduction histidine kinase
MHKSIPDPLAADKKLLDMLPLAIVIVDANASGYYINPRAGRIFFPEHPDDLNAQIKQFNLTELSSDFSAEKFGYAQGWLHKNSCYQANLIFDLWHEKACYSIRIIPYTQADSNSPLLYLVSFEASCHSSAKNAAIKHSFRELKQFSRLSAMREISTSMADSLNQPLTAILSYTQAMQRMYLLNAEPEVIKAAMERVVINAQHAAQIIKDIRSRTTTTELNFEYVDIHQLIMNTIALTELNNPDCRIHLKTHFDRKVAAARIVRIQIKQVLLSLLTNAIEALSGTDIDQPKIIIETKLLKDELLITISDNGPGLNSKVKEKLFEPFVTTKKDGIGIGLSMSLYIIELHHGSLSISSNKSSDMSPDNGVQQGTRVSIRLPLYN